MKRIEITMKTVWNHPPRYIQFDLTTRCNLDCFYCRINDLKETAFELSCQQIITILDQIYQFAPLATIAFSGGEPLVRPDLKELLLYARQNYESQKIILLSNGTLINDQNLDWLKKCVNQFIISLDGADEKTNDQIRGGRSYQQTINAIQKLVHLQVRLAVHMTYINQNEAEPVRLMKQMHQLGVTEFHFRYFFSMGQAKNHALDCRQYQSICRSLYEQAGQLNIKLHFSDPYPHFLTDEKPAAEPEIAAELLEKKAIDRCLIGFNLLYINPQGLVQLCPYFPVYVADCKKEQVKEIWQQNELLNLYRNLSKTLEKKCGYCNYQFACGGYQGNCKCQNNESGEDPHCWIEYK